METEIDLAGPAGLSVLVEVLKGQWKETELMFSEHVLCASAYVYIERLPSLSVGFIILVL